MPSCELESLVRFPLHCPALGSKLHLGLLALNPKPYAKPQTVIVNWASWGIQGANLRGWGSFWVAPAYLEYRGSYSSDDQCFKFEAVVGGVLHVLFFWISVASEFRIKGFWAAPCQEARNDVAVSALGVNMLNDATYTAYQVPESFRSVQGYVWLHELQEDCGSRLGFSDFISGLIIA